MKTHSRHYQLQELFMKTITILSQYQKKSTIHNTDYL